MGIVAAGGYQKPYQSGCSDLSYPQTIGNRDHANSRPPRPWREVAFVVSRMMPVADMIYTFGASVAASSMTITS